MSHSDSTSSISTTRVSNNSVLTNIEEAGPLFAEQSEAGDGLGRLTDDVGKRLKDTGLVRLLQPEDFGGYEADPRDLLNAAMDVGNYCPSAGWVAGVVGVHPWELAFNDERLQEEVWGDDPDTWVASPYSVGGKAVPVDDGYTVNGHWKFSSGTDHCDWVVLGALVPGDGEGAPPTAMLHIMLPRPDYEILHDSWNVIGLEGTGSKDIVVRDTFVPDYRTLDVGKVLSGQAAVDSGRRQPIYRMPWSTMFPSAVSAGIVGIAEGTLKRAVEYQQERVSAVGVVQASDPHSRRTIGEAASDIRGARAQLVYNTGELYEAVCAGHGVTLEQRRRFLGQPGNRTSRPGRRSPRFTAAHGAHHSGGGAVGRDRRIRVAHALGAGRCVLGGLTRCGRPERGVEAPLGSVVRVRRYRSMGRRSPRPCTQLGSRPSAV